MSTIRFLAVSAFAALAAGCSVGDGSKLETIQVVQNLTTYLQGGEELQAKAYTCVPSTLTLVGKFTKGDVGNFSSRARWTSSNPAVVKVTNVGDPLNDGSGSVYLIGGILLPQAPGDAVVSADYLGKSAELPVTVKAVDNIQVLPADAKVVPRSFQQYSVRATLDGVPTDVTSSALLSFVEPVEDTQDFATIGSQAQLQVVTGIAAGGPFTVKADFGVPCTFDLTTSVTVADIPSGGLKLAFEDADGLRDGKMLQGTGQQLRLRAEFGDGTFQNLSTQIGSAYGYDVDGDGTCELLLEDPGTTAAPNPPAPVSFGTFLTGANGLSAVRRAGAGTVATKICASFGSTPDPDGTGPEIANNGTVSNTLDLSVIESALSTIAITASEPCTDPATLGCTPLSTTPPDPTAPVIKGGELLQLNAFGTFANGDQQNITKSVTWSSNDTRVANIVNGLTATAGVVVTLADFETADRCKTLDECTVTITGTWTNGTAETTDDVTQTIDVKIQRADDDPK